MPDLLPWYWRWGAVIALITAAVAAGAGWTYLHEERKHATVLAEISIAGKNQNAAAEAAIKAQKNITADVARAYDANVRSIDAYYNKRLRDTIASRSKVPAVSNSTGKADAPAADVKSSPGYIGLAHKCALTTAQLVNLQKWILSQEAIK